MGPLGGGAERFLDFLKSPFLGVSSHENSSQTALKRCLQVHLPAPRGCSCGCLRNQALSEALFCKFARTFGRKTRAGGVRGHRRSKFPTVSGDFSLAQKCITRDVTKDPVTCGIYRFFPCGDFTRCLGMKKSLAGDFQLENVQTHYASRNAVPFLRDRSLREPVTLSQRSHKDASL